MISKFEYAPAQHDWIRILSFITGIIIILAAITSADGKFSLKLPISTEDPVINFFWSFFSEYMNWSIQSTNQTLIQMRSAYNLTGIYEWPLIGAFATSGFLLVNGHLGALLFMIQNSILFTIIGAWILKFTLRAAMPRALLKIPLIYDFLEILLAALLAIAITSLF